jgi:hypothetical protein
MLLLLAPLLFSCTDGFLFGYLEGLNGLTIPCKLILFRIKVLPSTTVDERGNLDSLIIRNTIVLNGKFLA